MIYPGGIPNPDILSDSKINLGNDNNPVNATYSSSGASTLISGNIWTSNLNIIYPTAYSAARLALGYNAMSGSERLRVNGTILTTGLTTTTLNSQILSLLGGSYYANITGTFTTTRFVALPDKSGTIAFTDDIYTFSNQSLLATYTNTNADITSAIGYSHTHSNFSALGNIIESGDGSTFLDNSGTYRTILYSDISGAPTELTPADHTHDIDELNDFGILSPVNEEIIQYNSVSGLWENVAKSIGWNEITGIPSTFTPESHTHTISEITDIDDTGLIDGDVLIYDTGEFVRHALHIFTNESILDNITQDVIDNEHTHTNLSIIEQVTQDIIDDSHTHTNLTLLETITDAGGGTSFLADDGTYKTISLTAAGSDTQITFNDSGTASGDSTFTFNTATKVVAATIVQTNSAFYIEDSATTLTVDGSGNLVFTDAITGSVDLATIVAGATNYWTATTGGIYYSSYISNHVNPAAELDIDGQIITNEGFISTYFRYTGSNMLIGPNAGNNEGSSSRLYIHNTDSATPLIYGEFNTSLLRFYANVYIPNSYSLNFGSSTNSIYRYAGGDQLVFEDGTANGGDPIFLTEFIDGTYNARVEDFDDLTTVQGITSADTSIWDNASVLITGGGGDQYLANDGTYKPVSAGGLSTHLYLHNESSDIGGYEQLLTSPANDVEDSDTVAVTTGTSPVTIDVYATESGYPGITEIPAGLWTFKTWLSVDSAVGTTTVDIEVYKRDTGGTETLLFSVTTIEINATSATQYIIETVQAAQTLDATDRLVIKYVANTDTASSIDVTLYYEGTAHYSYLIMPLAETVFEINDNIFDWDTSNLYYTPYADKTAAGGAASDGKFYLGTTDPDDTTRLNYDGHFYATRMITPDSGTSSGFYGECSGTGSVFEAYASSSGAGIYGYNSSTGYGLYGYNDSTGKAIGASVVGGIGLEITRASTGSTSANLVELIDTSSIGNRTGNFIHINDSPTTVGTLGGKILSVNLSGSERIKFEPRIATSGSAVAYLFDTSNDLNTSGDILLNILNQGVEKFSIFANGDQEIPRGQYIYQRQTLGSDTDGDIRTYSDASGYYIERRVSSAWVVIWDITF